MTSSVVRNDKPTEAAPAVWSTRAKTARFLSASVASNRSIVSFAEKRLCTDTMPLFE